MSLHDQLLADYSEEFAARFDALLGDAARFGYVASIAPSAWARYNSGGRLSLSARRLQEQVVGHSAFGFPSAGLNVVEGKCLVILDAALAFGEAYRKASALYDAGEGDMRQRFTPAFEAADRQAGEAWAKLEQVAIDAFGVEEPTPC
jgi:hypothetical protein